MSAVKEVRTGPPGTRLPWGNVLLSATAAVCWALIGMAGTAALGLHLLGADSAGSLGPMTAAVVALGAGGSVSPSGDMSAFGLTGAQAHTAVAIAPLGVSLVGALLLSWVFLRSLRAAGAVIAPSELLARAGAVVVLFVALLGGLAWAGQDVVTIDGGSLGLGALPGAGGNDGGIGIPGLGDLGGLGDIGGLLPDRISDLVDAKAAVGFTVDTAPTLLGGLGWVVGVLLLALIATRRAPLPRGFESVHRVVRPAVSALAGVLVMAVVAGLAAAVFAAVGDDHPERITGAALLGAPNGVWLGVPLGLFVPFDGKATGALTSLLPDPLDRLLGGNADQPVTLSRLADLDGRVWLLGAAAVLMMLLAGVLTAVRTPVGTRGGTGVVGGVRAGSGARGADGKGAVGGTGAGTAGGAKGADSAVPPGATGAGPSGPGALGFAGRCALRLGVTTALALPLLAWLADVSVGGSLSVLGFDAFGAGIDLHGRLGTALLLGAVWGAVAGAVGALLAWAVGAAGRRAASSAMADGSGDAEPVYGPPREGSGPYTPRASYRPPNPDTNPYLKVPDELRDPGVTRARRTGGPAGTAQDGTRPGNDATPSGGGRPTDDAMPSGEGRPTDDAMPSGEGRPLDGATPSGGARPVDGARPLDGPRPPDDVYGAATMVGPLDPPSRPGSPPGQRSGPRRGNRPPGAPDDGPPPPPPAPPRRPGGRS
ncbi:streptophobe family protein [Streptomyces sp. NPDC006012]|uniref:streptophobe family protein n=1 Tax=Streptomyces sp. NPDC006012 TaxID=3364739 RepID=UPI0036978BD6